MTRYCIIIALFVLFKLGDGRKLGNYNVDKAKISVSGLSSGGGMTVQFHIAHSASIMGAAPFAGIPYACTTVENCDAETITEFINNASRDGHIDNPENIKNHNIYVFHGVNDYFVDIGSAYTIRDTYTRLQAKSVTTNLTSIAGHGMPTINYGVECNDTWIPGINRCNWQGAWHVTNAIYGNLNPPSEGQPGDGYTFEQSEFTAAVGNHSMDDSAYVYIPTRCMDSSKQCRLHVVFHGCFQARENMEAEYANSTGYNEVGEANDIIMLYPQARSELNDVIVNPTGCWDAAGFTGDDHMYKSAPQIRVIKAEIDRITG